MSACVCRVYMSACVCRVYMSACVCRVYMSAYEQCTRSIASQHDWKEWHSVHLSRGQCLKPSAELIYPYHLPPSSLLPAFVLFSSLNLSALVKAKKSIHNVWYFEGKEFILFSPLAPPFTNSNDMHMLLQRTCRTTLLRLGKGVGRGGYLGLKEDPLRA